MVVFFVAVRVRVDEPRRWVSGNALSLLRLLLRLLGECHHILHLFLERAVLEKVAQLHLGEGQGVAGHRHELAAAAGELVLHGALEDVLLDVGRHGHHVHFVEAVVVGEIVLVVVVLQDGRLVFFTVAVVDGKGLVEVVGDFHMGRLTVND